MEGGWEKGGRIPKEECVLCLMMYIAVFLISKKEIYMADKGNVSSVMSE